MLKNFTIACALWCFLVSSHELTGQEPALFSGQNTDPPIVTITGKHITCFGDSTGSITVKVHSDPQFIIYGLYDKTPATKQKFLAQHQRISNEHTFSGLTAGHYHLLVRDSLNHRIVQEIVLAQPDKIEFQGFDILQEPSTESASDGAISIQISGGTPPYSISWDEPAKGNNPAISNIPYGNYSCTITDINNCTATKPTIFFYPKKTQKNE